MLCCAKAAARGWKLTNGIDELAGSEAKAGEKNKTGREGIQSFRTCVLMQMKFHTKGTAFSLPACTSDEIPKGCKSRCVLTVFATACGKTPAIRFGIRFNGNLHYKYAFLNSWCR